jgi:hypothetical protein
MFKLVKLDRLKFPAGVLVGIMIFSGSAMAFNNYVSDNTPANGYLLCANNKTKVVTFPNKLTCPAGTKALDLGAVTGIEVPKGPAGPEGPKGLTGDASTSIYNLKLKDASGKIVEDLVTDGIVFKDGYYWNLDYATGQFSPTGALYSVYKDSECRGDLVHYVFGIDPVSANTQFEIYKKSLLTGVLYSLYGDSGILDIGPYKVTGDATLIDNRNTLMGEILNDGQKTTFYRKNTLLNNKCEPATEVWFYSTGVEKSTIKIPSPLPAPVGWFKG